MSLKVAVIPSITGKLNQVPLKKKDIEFLTKEFADLI